MWLLPPFQHLSSPPGQPRETGPKSSSGPAEAVESRAVHPGLRIIRSHGYISLSNHFTNLRAPQALIRILPKIGEIAACIFLHSHALWRLPGQVRHVEAAAQSVWQLRRMCLAKVLCSNFSSLHQRVGDGSVVFMNSCSRMRC